MKKPITSFPVMSLINDLILDLDIEEGNRFSPVPFKVGLWRASHLPHLSGFPLVIPSACGRNEVYHLKAPSYPIKIIAELFLLVKDFFVVHIVLPPGFTNIPTGNDGIFETIGIS